MNKQSSIKTDKRKFMKFGMAGTAAAAAGVSTWSKPVIESTVLPAHAQTTATIVDIAAGNPNFSTLVELLSTEPDLVELLSGPGPFTVWAPTNQAFTDAGGDITTYTGGGGTVRDILVLHVANGIVPGTPLPTNNSSTTPMIIDGPITASNGQIFVIDYVLIPV